KNSDWSLGSHEPPRSVSRIAEFARHVPFFARQGAPRPS
ncbi:MAG: hypothetical protein ACI9HE_003498, partial [Planctomycetota bacterium]